MNVNTTGLNSLVRELQGRPVRGSGQDGGEAGGEAQFENILGLNAAPKVDVGGRADKALSRKLEPRPRQLAERAEPKPRENSDRLVGREPGSEASRRVDDRKEVNVEQTKEAPKRESKGDAPLSDSAWLASLMAERQAQELSMSNMEEASLSTDGLPGGPTGPNLGPLAIDRIPTTPMDMSMNKTSDSASMFGSETKSDDVDSLTRRAVWHDFLRKMKEELGVSAEDMLGAFASLSPEELAQPPQATLDKVVMALGLDASSTQVAKQFLGELIQKTQPKSMGEELKTSSQQIDLSMMTQRELDRKQINQRLDQMSANFFAKEQLSGDDRAVNTSAQASGPMAELMPLNGLQSQAKLAENVIKDFMNVQPVTSGKSEDSLTGGAVDLSSSLSLAMNPEEAADENLDNSSFDGTGFLGGLGIDSQTQIVNGQSGVRSELAPAQGPAGGAAMKIDELISQAEVMVRDGGGEMKVKLNPEGLGEVAMRVNVENGKVSVQMVTESDEAKRLIERQMSELKSQLSSNNLQLETIKVDTASNLGKQLEQQYQDAQRNLAQQTFEQFRQEQQGWRRSFFEVPGARQYKGQAEAPRDSQPPLNSVRTMGSRRLNLVA